ncbi:hypothetical protein OGAPHI_000344 [Ogataea philodendri]|uniref:Uncharacterized protein n=1 Tax=Ogataea philodendri TaxID=1378263 RepID=A0A9P8PI26_9ASCO|nr:uncharacterized protein OGAPHI_000344 [Ogataea philodendri]KAH3671639.1 hypothetical protein OGAPHI_000344 [Ogataea philodendri]
MYRWSSRYLMLLSRSVDGICANCSVSGSSSSSSSSSNGLEGVWSSFDAAGVLMVSMVVAALVEADLGAVVAAEDADEGVSFLLMNELFQPS